MDRAGDQASLTIVNPVAEPQAHEDDAERFAPAPRPSTLAGKTVALYWNGKQNGLDALDRTKQHLTKQFDDIRFVEVTGELGGTNRYLSPGQLAMLEAEVDVAVCTTADCGSCCSWLMRDLCELERRGIPAVGYTAAIFDEDARFSLETFGVPEDCLAKLRALPGVTNVTVEDREQAQVLAVHAPQGLEMTHTILAVLGETQIGRVSAREPTLEDAYVALVTAADENEAAEPEPALV